MALINCPECGKEVSDKAATCTNCGYVINSEITTHNISKTKKPFFQNRTFWIITICILVVIGGIIGFEAYRNYSTQKQLEEAQQKQEQLETEYYSNMKDTFLNLAEATKIAVTLNSQIDTAWDAANKSFTGVYNLNLYVLSQLKILYEQDDFSTQAQKLLDLNNKIAQNMESLRTPPEKYNEAYMHLKKFSDSYTSLVSYIVSPDKIENTPLDTFRKDCNTATANVIQDIKDTKLYFDDLY